MSLKNQLLEMYNDLINDDSNDFELMDSKSFIFEAILFGLYEDQNGYYWNTYKNIDQVKYWSKGEKIVQIFLGYKG